MNQNTATVTVAAIIPNSDNNFNGILKRRTKNAQIDTDNFLVTVGY
jgi:hypothetical protein